MNKPILFLDFNNLAIRTLFAQKELIANPNPDFSLHKHLVLATIFANIKKFEPYKVVLAIDDKNNWRKKVYPEYKANRREQRDKDVFPWDKYYEHIDGFVADIKATFPFVVLQIPYAEADDTIAVLAKHISEKCVIVTSDSDYIQLLAINQLERSGNRIKIWDPMKTKWVEDPDPTKTLMIKVLAGDSGDNVPNIRPKLGPKTAEKLLASGELDKFLKDNGLLENFERNQKLVDWNHIPGVLKKRILDEYNAVVISSTPPDFFGFCVRNHLRKLSEQSQEIGFIMQPLLGGVQEAQEEFFV